MLRRNKDTDSAKAWPAHWLGDDAIPLAGSWKPHAMHPEHQFMGNYTGSSTKVRPSSHCIYWDPSKEEEVPHPTTSISFSSGSKTNLKEIPFHTMHIFSSKIPLDGKDLSIYFSLLWADAKLCDFVRTKMKTRPDMLKCRVSQGCRGLSRVGTKSVTESKIQSLAHSLLPCCIKWTRVIRREWDHASCSHLNLCINEGTGDCMV